MPFLSFLRYLRKLVRVRRAAPITDLVSALVQAEQAGDKLSEDELLVMIFLLIVAGYETTVNLIGNGTLALLQHPEELRRLRDEPSLSGAAVEELLRYANPAGTTMERYARNLDDGRCNAPSGRAGCASHCCGKPRRATVSRCRATQAEPFAEQAPGIWLGRTLLCGRAAGAA